MLETSFLVITLQETTDSAMLLSLAVDLSFYDKSSAKMLNTAACQWIVDG